MARPAKDWTNVRKGSLVALERVGTRGTSPLWRCRCDCGNIKDMSTAQLAGGTISCGCVRQEYWDKGLHATHGHARHKNRSRAYNSWNGMKSRCLYPSQPHYERYGGRGITVCKRWMTFDNFLADMGEPPEGCSLERKDNDGNYQPGNVIWATSKKQGNNTRRNMADIEFRGEAKSLQDWCDELGLKYHTMYRRLHKGLSPEDAFTAPLRTWPSLLRKSHEQ